MKNEPAPAQSSTWYEQRFDSVELVNTNPDLAPYLDVDKFPEHQVNLVAKLMGQSLPLTPPKELKTVTPEKLGLLLGQQCATLYALGESLQSLGNNPDAVKRGEKNLNHLRTQRHVPGVSSALHGVRITELMAQELVKNISRFEQNVHATFKAALDQPNYREAVEFFRGFATGMATPGIKAGKLVRRNKATNLQLKMFLHTEQAGECKTVAELRALLLKNGFTEETLGDDERLQKFCYRIGYAPGKRGRPSKKK